MELPIELKTAIDNRTAGIKQKQLLAASQDLSDRYRNESGQGKRLLTTDIEAVAYSLVRMPATYGAVYTAMEYANRLLENEDIGSTLLDVGAGTGAGTWAVCKQLQIKHITCLEKENAMIKLGQQYMKESSDEALRNAQWKSFDLLSGNIVKKADIVLASYVLNELRDDDRLACVKKLWNATNKMLVLVEPGTPVGYSQLRLARTELIKYGAHILAPCPHENLCPIEGDDWCHFTVRVSRTKLHRLLKQAQAPYEDEKFSYLIVTREEFSRAKNRVLRHPIIEPGKISLQICDEHGKNTYVYRKKDGQVFKKARKIKCGEEL